MRIEPPKRVVLCALNELQYFDMAQHYLKQYVLEDESIKKKYYFDLIAFSLKSSTKYIAGQILIKQPDIIGFTTFLWNIDKVLEISSHLKKRNKQFIIILGGVEASARKEQILNENESIDVIVDGEGEEVFQKLLKELIHGNNPQFRNIKGIAFREDKTAMVTEKNGIINDLSKIPSIFLSSKSAEAIRPLQLFQTMRGCKYRCSYCMWDKYRYLRYFPLPRVLDELKFLLLNPSVKQIYFTDSDILFSKERSLEIFSTIIKHNHENKKCIFEVNPELFTTDHIEILSKAAKGSFEFHCAFQSSNQMINAVLGRKIDIEKVKKNMALLMEYCSAQRILIEFTYAFPHQTLKSFVDDTIDPIIHLNPHAFFGTRLYVLPGSIFFQHPDKYGILDFNKNPSYEIIETKAMSKDEINLLPGVLKSLGFIYARKYIRDSFDHVLSYMKNRSFGESYVELAMHLSMKGGPVSPIVLHNYIKYIKKICVENELPEKVFRECFNIFISKFQYRLISSNPLKKRN